MASGRYKKHASANAAAHNKTQHIPIHFQQETYDDQSHHDPPPRKEKDKQKQHKKKRTHDEAVDGNTSRIHPGSPARRDASHKSNGDDEEEDDDEADDEQPAVKHHKKKQKRHPSASGSATASPNLSRPSSATSGTRLILRLPSSNRGATSDSKLVKNKKKDKQSNKSPQRRSNKPTHSPSSFPPTALSSPLSSVDSDLARLHGSISDDDDNISDLELSYPYSAHNFAGAYSSDSSDSSDSMSDMLDDDDEDDLEGEEERYLIAERIRKKKRGGRTSKGQSPTLSYEPERGHTSEENDLNDLELIGSHNDLAGSQQESVLLEITRLHNRAEDSDSRYSDNPVTWSGAEDSDLNDLDELLGLTAEESAVIIGEYSTEDEDNKTMRFEDFLAQDDGDASDSTSETSSDEDETEADAQDDKQSVAGTVTDIPETDADDEHISTTRAVVSNGGFVFYKKTAGGSEETSDEEVTDEDVSDNGGDTTDTLDDTDHIGMLRFGIEAADEDDEDAEEALAAARRDRNLIDARNLGLSISMNALAEQPEAVIAKTARSLGVSTETAAKILTSVGMSILVNDPKSQQPHSQLSASRTAQNSGYQRPQPQEMQQSRTVSTMSHPLPISTAAPILANSVGNGTSGPKEVTFVAPAPPPSTSEKENRKSSGALRQSQPPKPDGPILGNFAPSGEADLCVVVSNDAPAPSPFSARKKRRPRRLTDGSPSGGPHHRGHSIVSTISSRSVNSVPPYHSNSSEEPLYNVFFDFEELVDSTMLPSGMSEMSEEETDMDDAASTRNGQSVGDVSRWNRIPIGAFRTQHPGQGPYASLATAVFSGSRRPEDAHNLSFHGGVAPTRKSKKKRYIPVSPVLFPVGHPLKSISNAKSRKEKRKERKQGKAKKESPAPSRLSVPGQAEPPTISISSPFTIPNAPVPSLPSDGLTHHVSPLFSGVASGLSIPPFSL